MSTTNDNRMGRGQFKKVLGLVIARKKSQEKVDSQEDWKNVKYMVFDVPEVDGIYEARMAISSNRQELPFFDLTIFV